MRTLVNPARLIGRVFTCAAAMALIPAQLLAHTCPADATATGVGVTVTALRSNGVPVGTGFVAPCEPIILQMSIVYFPVDPITGGNNAAFEGGQMQLVIRGAASNVTPAGGVPLMGGDGTPGCSGLTFFRSLQLPYTVTDADAAAGSIPILAIYTNGTAHISANNLPGVVSGTQGFVVNVRPGVTCAITPGTNVICQGGSATFTVSATNGSAPYSFRWTGPNNFSTNGPTITIGNAQAANAGVYQVVVTDFFGCTNVCRASLVVQPAPTCSISKTITNVCHPSTNSFTATINPPTPGATFKWTITGQGQIVGPDNQATVQVRTTGAGSYTVNNVLSAGGCSNTCSKTVTVRLCETSVVLIKEIVCWTPDGCAPFTGADTAVGVRSGEQCPAFCYRITVRNTSPPGVEIRNLLVQDNRLNLSSCNFPSTLAPGASFVCILSNITHCEDLTSTATVTGTGHDVTTGAVIGPVSTNDTTRAVIVPISVACEKTVSSPHDTDPGPGVLLPADGLPHAVTFGVTVENPSTLPLVVHISDPALQECPLPAEFTNGVTIPPGQSVTWSNICTAMLQCGMEPLLGGLTNTVFVTAVVDTSVTNFCPFDRDGALVTASNNCSAVVQCPTGAGCTPGFWKNCPIHWQLTGLTQNQPLNSVFRFNGCCPELRNVSLRDALDFGGGSGVCGGARILLRASVAALLNASSPEVNYPLTREEVIARVNAALATCRRGPILALAGELDRNNNLGCRDNSGNSLPCKRLTIAE